MAVGLLGVSLQEQKVFILGVIATVKKKNNPKYCCSTRLGPGQVLQAAWRLNEIVSSHRDLQDDPIYTPESEGNIFERLSLKKVGYIN